MKIKTIKKELQKAFNGWVVTLPEHIQKLAKAGTIITGGSIVSMLQGEEIRDFDLYFRDHLTCLTVAKYYAEYFKDQVEIRDNTDQAGQPCPGRISIRVDPKITYKGEEEASDDSPIAAEGEDEKHQPIFFSSNAITLSGKIQIIIRFYGEPEEIHKNYDFVHCTCYWTSWNKELVTSVEALQSILTRELKYVGSKYPLCSLIRIRKFIERKWTINAGQILKIAMQLNEMELTNINVLQDQLIGVDSAYFAQVLNELQERNMEVVDTAYLMEIIDRIF